MRCWFHDTSIFLYWQRQSTSVLKFESTNDISIGSNGYKLYFSVWLVCLCQCEPFDDCTGHSTSTFNKCSFWEWGSPVLMFSAKLKEISQGFWFFNFFFFFASFVLQRSRFSISGSQFRTNYRRNPKDDFLWWKWNFVSCLKRHYMWNLYCKI